MSVHSRKLGAVCNRGWAVLIPRRGQKVTQVKSTRVRCAPRAPASGRPARPHELASLRTAAEGSHTHCCGGWRMVCEGCYVDARRTLFTPSAKLWRRWLRSGSTGACPRLGTRLQVTLGDPSWGQRAVAAERRLSRGSGSPGHERTLVLGHAQSSPLCCEVGITVDALRASPPGASVRVPRRALRRE